MIARSSSALHLHIKYQRIIFTSKYKLYDIYVFKWECLGSSLLPPPHDPHPTYRPHTKNTCTIKSLFWELHFIRRSMLPTTFSSSSSYYYSLFFFFELNVIVFYSTLILLGNRVSCQRPFEQNKWALWVLHNNETPIHIKLLMLASSNSAWWWWYAKMRPN